MSAQPLGTAAGLPFVRKDAKAEDIVTINMVEDGLTAFGAVWYKGQEIAVERNSPDWERTVDQSTGISWIDADEDEQLARWGKRMFRPGKWAGESFDLNDPNLSDESRTTLEAVIRSGAIQGRPAKTRTPPTPPKIS